MTTAATAGRTASRPIASRQPDAAATSATPTRPTSPPTTSASTYAPIASPPAEGLQHVGHPTASRPGMHSPCAARHTSSTSKLGAAAAATWGRRAARSRGRAHAAGRCDPERSPQPHADCDGRDDDRDREARASRADAEVAPELRQDRLRRVHRREHPGASQQEARHAAEPAAVCDHYRAFRTAARRENRPSRGRAPPSPRVRGR